MSIRVDQGITCPSCGTQIGSVLEIEVETRMTTRLVILSIVIGLAFGVSLAALADKPTFLEAAGVAAVTASIAFLIFLRILPRPSSGRLIREIPQAEPPGQLAQAHAVPDQTLELEPERAAVGVDSDASRV